MAAGGHFENCHIPNFVNFCSKMMCNTSKTDEINPRNPFLASFLTFNACFMVKFKMAADDNYGNKVFLGEISFFHLYAILNDMTLISLPLVNYFAFPL